MRPKRSCKSQFDATAYDSARKPYPQAVINYCNSYIPKSERPILDLGCGTGIASRQISRLGWRITACDPDPQLLSIAESYQTQGIVYHRTAAESLSFENQSFAAVTAFGSFHWFANADALEEIRRVLIPDGVLLIVNKNDKGQFAHDVRQRIAEIAESPSMRTKQNYIPEVLLEKHGFKRIETIKFESIEVFNIEELIMLCRSMSAWNELSLSQEPGAEEVLRKHFSPHLKDGLYSRPIEVRLVSAVRSSI